MAFLDNSGDIILDAVLTDTGRYRLAKGDGSFRIAKFALGDDEIDYGLYNRNDSRGSAYFDIDILSAPIFEAFTDNASGLKSKLLTIARTDLRFLPVIKRNVNQANGGALPIFSNGSAVYCVASDEETQDSFRTANSPILTGLFGSVTPRIFPTQIQLHQGLDTTQISYDNRIDSDLKETQYIVEIDSRLGSIITPGGAQEAEISYIDDDQIASYYFTLNSDSDFVQDISATPLANQPGGLETNVASIAGPRGTRLSFGIKGGLELQSSTFLFEQLGSTLGSLTINDVSVNGWYYIDTNIRVTGATTGYRIDIPVRFLKKN